MNNKTPEYCSNCRQQITNKKAIFCPKCGNKLKKEIIEEEIPNKTTYFNQQNENIKSDVRYHKNPILAALLSFFLFFFGQFYNGQILKGLLFICVAFILGLIHPLISFLFVIYSTFDAYKSAKYINEHNGNYFFNENLKSRERI